MNNIEKIADKLRQTWNAATGSSQRPLWADLNERARQGYLAVAKAAVECACEAQHRDLVAGDVIQEGDEVWAFGTGPWTPVTPTEHGRTYRNGYNRMRRLATAEKQCRDLEVGELIHEGDEYCMEGTPWVLAKNSVGEPYWNTDLKFRRPVITTGAHLTDVNADQRQQIEHLEKEVAVLKNHNQTLQKGLLTLSHGWDKVISYVVNNSIGVVGKTFPEIVLQTLKNQIDWKGHHDSLKRQADAAMVSRDAKIHELQQLLDRVEEKAPIILDTLQHHGAIVANKDAKIKYLTEKLNNAQTYIHGLEKDLSFYSTVEEFFKVKLEGAAHGE